jgi:glycosyltransferase involved in cell wall biosynthesis
MTELDKMFVDTFNFLDKLMKTTFQLFKKPRVVLIIPARNEEKNIARVIRTGKKSRYVTDILVVDSFSVDKTAKVAKESGASVIRQYHKKGKGGAIYTGIKEANGEIFVVMDADIENISQKMIDKLVRPIIKENVDYVIGNFKLERGRVTKFTALPLLKLFFPEIKFKQPLSGLFAAKSRILRKLEVKEGWSIEISLTLDMVMGGYRTKEVYLGEIKHTENPVELKTRQAQEIAKTLIQKAHEYKRIKIKKDALKLIESKYTK